MRTQNLFIALSAAMLLTAAPAFAQTTVQKKQPTARRWANSAGGPSVRQAADAGRWANSAGGAPNRQTADAGRRVNGTRR